MKFFICNHCKNLAELVVNRGVPMMCCGDEMAELVANTEEASTEKHLPVITVDGDKVTVDVGSVAHPMEEKHYISFIVLEADCGIQRKHLKIGEEPKVTFTGCSCSTKAVYAYCNLHGMWKTEI